MSMSVFIDTNVLIALDKQILDQAIDSRFKDLEDAIQYFSAVRARADCIVTRDADAFPRSDLPVLTPGELLTIGSF